MNTDPDFKFPEAPSYFDDQHKLAWETVYRSIDGEFPSTTIEAYVLELLRWRDSERWLAEHGPDITLRDDKGVVKGVIAAPRLKIARDASVRVEKLAKVLRLRVHVEA